MLPASNPDGAGWALTLFGKFPLKKIPLPPHHGARWAHTSISELAIDKQWDIVKQGSLHQSFDKSCPT